MMESLLPFFEWADNSWLAETIRDSAFYFSAILTVHLFALTVLLGAILFLNLRLCGIIMRQQPVSHLARELAPWVFWSFLVMVISGSLMFVSEAVRLWASGPFQVKMMLLLSAIVWHYTVHRTVSQSDRDSQLRLNIFVAGVSLLLWFGTGLAGRAIGFL
jgi:hypothetical protein